MHNNLWKKGIVYGIILLLLITGIPFGQSLNQLDSFIVKCQDTMQDTTQPILINKSLESRKQIISQKVASEGRTNQSWWNANWTYRKKITIDHTKVVGDLVNFPILIITTMNTSKVQNDGDDIVFTDNQGMKLNHEIESYDTNSGSLITWVNVTTVSSIQNTILYMYYGNPLSTNQQNVIGTWDANYLAVWHFSETAGFIVKDSTINDFTGNANTHATISDGVIGKARYFDGSGSVSIGSPSQFGGLTTFSIEAWGDPFSTIGEHRLFDRGNNGNPNTILFYCTSADFHLTINNDDDIAEYNVLNQNNWKYYAGTYIGSGGEKAVYTNGIKMNAGTTTQTGTMPGLFPINIGHTSIENGGNWYGKLDEIRVSKIARTQQWINTSYTSMSSPSSFVTFGEEEIGSSPQADFTYTPLNPTNSTLIHFIDNSTDTIGIIISWLWDFGDQYYSTLQNPNHCYYNDGIYNVTLTVTDDYDISNSTQKVIIVYTPLNHPPNVPENPFPADGTTNIPIDTDLSWTGGDPDGDPVNYDVYFGITSPPPKIIANQSETNYYPGTLGYNTTYYWKIDAWDNQNNHADGSVWHFKTKPNTPPNIPTINGPATGKIGITYNYTFVSVDPENDSIFYQINWGDGTVDDWYGPVESNVIITRSHIWSEKGSYTIQARAKDIHGAIGLWGSLSVTMPMDDFQQSQQSQEIKLPRTIISIILK